jgi:hypothetical protein
MMTGNLFLGNAYLVLNLFIKIVNTKSKICLLVLENFPQNSK